MIHSGEWRKEQAGFRVSARRHSRAPASDIFELEAAARECFERLQDQGFDVSVVALFREVYDGRVVEETEKPVAWA